MSGDPTLHLAVLRERNAGLEHRMAQLTELSGNLEDNVVKIQGMYEAMIESQENQCIDMVQFDDEIRTLRKMLFPVAPQGPVTPRRRDENSNLIMTQILALQRLERKQCDEQLQKNDPLLRRARKDINQVHKFIGKYGSFL